MKALILARGLGTRMQRADADAPLTAEQQRAADAGLKALMPIHGRPFLDYLISALADAGSTDVGLVVAPEHAALSARYAAHPPARVSLAFLVQPEALGTANAVLAGEAWAAGEAFLTMNADNLYPVAALRDLATAGEPALPVFDARDLVATSNIPEDRIRAFALVEIDGDGYLSRIVEKPGVSSSVPPDGGSCADADVPPAGSYARAGVSMNLWRFDTRVFDACRDVPRSARGEYELPEAVALAIGRGVRFRALRARGPVLDLSRRADAADVERRLAGVVPRP